MPRAEARSQHSSRSTVAASQCRIQHHPTFGTPTRYGDLWDIARAKCAKNTPRSETLHGVRFLRIFVALSLTCSSLLLRDDVSRSLLPECSSALVSTC